MKVRVERWTHMDDRHVQDIVEYEFEHHPGDANMVELVRQTRAVFDERTLGVVSSIGVVSGSGGGAGQGGGLSGARWYSKDEVEQLKREGKWRV